LKQSGIEKHQRESFYLFAEILKKLLI